MKVITQGMLRNIQDKYSDVHKWVVEKDKLHLDVNIIGKTAAKVVDLKPLIESLSEYDTLYLDAHVQYILTQPVKLKQHIKILGNYGTDEYVKSTIKYTGTGYAFQGYGQLGNTKWNLLSVDIRDCIFEGNGQMDV